MKSVAERTCVICRTKKLKHELFRFLNEEGKVSFDKDQKKPGRAFYICSKKCWDSCLAKKRKIRIGSDARQAVSVTLPDKTFEEATKL
jgi:predicted RNA-binding protein YlxR (DUF448 family)